MIPNTSALGRAYGIHATHTGGLITELADDIMTMGTDVTYQEATAEILSKAKDWLDDRDAIKDYTAPDPYEPGEDSIIDGLFYDFIAEALKAADVISFTDKRPTEGTDAGLVELVAGCFDAESGFDFEEVNDHILTHVNDMGYLQDGEPHTYTYEQSVKLEDGTEKPVKMMLSPLGGAQLLWVMESPFMTPCDGLQPLHPGPVTSTTPVLPSTPTSNAPAPMTPPTANGRTVSRRSGSRTVTTPCPTTRSTTTELRSTTVEASSSKSTPRPRRSSSTSWSLPMREHYNNGDPIDLKHNGCDGCSPSMINGVLVHERGCPDAWRDAEDNDDADSTPDEY